MKVLGRNFSRAVRCIHILSKHEITCSYDASLNLSKMLLQTLGIMVYT